MRLFINCLAASAGGGLTYIRNVIPLLAAHPDLQFALALNANLRTEFGELADTYYVEISSSAARRFWQEQSQLPSLIRKSHSNVLLSTGNFALRNSPVPQILLSRNSIYCNRDFYMDLRARGEYRLWLDTHIRGILARRSVRWANATVAPSNAFAAELQDWTGVAVRTIHHGFDREQFRRDTTALPAEVEAKLEEHRDSFRLLFVSHYNYYRNFETLFRALPALRRAANFKPIKLFLTCKLSPGENPGSYNPESAARLIKRLAIDDMVVQLGAIPYTQLHHLYSRCHIYVTPAYAETFAHPLVEAMSSGLPVVASDIPVHREICGEAGSYFEKFSPEALAKSVMGVASAPTVSEGMSAAGLVRSQAFSWKVHVAQLIDLSRQLAISLTRSA